MMTELVTGQLRFGDGKPEHQASAGGAAAGNEVRSCR